MPEYTAYCPSCDRRVDYQSSVAERDQALTEIEQCCDKPLRRLMYAPKSISCLNFENINANRGRGEMKSIYTQLGKDDKGDWRRPVGSKRDIIKLHDDYNRAHPGEEVSVSFA